MKIKSKAVAFNLDDPVQASMYAHIGRMSNFSAYLKLLIWQDMNGVPRQDDAPAPEESGIDASLMEDLV